jgi:hypothetical protein
MCREAVHEFGSDLAAGVLKHPHAMLHGQLLTHPWRPSGPSSWPSRCWPSRSSSPSSPSWPSRRRSRAGRSPAMVVVVEVQGKVVWWWSDILQQRTWCLPGHVATGRTEHAAWLEPAHHAHKTLHDCRCLSKRILYMVVAVARISNHVS